MEIFSTFKTNISHVLKKSPGARDHRPVPGPGPQGRGAQDHARAEADQGRPADQVRLAIIGMMKMTIRLET